jgi:signal transduction histidine kinase
MELAGAELRRLAALVQDFLQFARPQPLRLSFMNLRTTVQLTLDLLVPEAEPLGVDLTLNPGEAVWLEYDDEKIRQVLFNLVRNALEASERGGRVVLDLRPGERSAVLDVEDEGRGLATDQPIFEPFFTTKETGTGLGLAIVHRIIEDHGGSITVHSRPGCTVFSVSLPRVGAASPDSARGSSGTTSA